MLLLQIKNKEWLTRMVSYCDKAGIEYTTNTESHYDKILFMEFTTSVLSKIKDSSKKVFFLSYLEEERLYQMVSKRNSRARAYQAKARSFFKYCDLIVVSQNGIKQFIQKLSSCTSVIIPYELPVINVSLTRKEFYHTYPLAKRTQKILVFDSEYRSLKWVNELASRYPKYQILYFGYAPESDLTESKRQLLHHLKENILLIKYYDFFIFSDFVKLSSMVILMDTILDHAYLDLILYFCKPFLMNESSFYNDYFIDSKNCYTFTSGNRMLEKMSGMISGKLPNLTESGYQLIKENSENEIVKKYSNSIR